MLCRSTAWRFSTGVLLAGAVCLGYYTLGLMSFDFYWGSPGGRHYGFLAEYVARDTDGND